MIDYKLAKQLEKAGFPQPKPKFFQVWYADYDNGYMLGRKLLVGTNFFSAVQKMEQPMVFCPTFEDIWEQLPELIPHKTNPDPHFLTLNKGKICYTDKDNFVFFIDKGIDTSVWIEQDIEARDISAAAAKLWLTLKEQGLIQPKQ